MAQNWQDRAVMMLAILAEQAKTMSYDDFAAASDVPAPHRIHKLTDFLEELIARDIADKKPIRAAVVVSKICIMSQKMRWCVRQHIARCYKR